MSWMQRLILLNEKTHQNLESLKESPALETVFLDGSKHLKDPIMKEISKDYSWADISNMSFKTLPHFHRDKLLKTMLNNRNDSKIYKHSNQGILLTQIVQKFIETGKKVDRKMVKNLYDECCKALQKPSNDKIVVVIDCRKTYFEDYKSNFTEIVLTNTAFISLLSKSYLFPFIEFFLVCDEVNKEEIEKTDEKEDIIDHLQKMLMANRPSGIKIHFNLDENTMKEVGKIIVSAHRVNDLTDFEAC